MIDSRYAVADECAQFPRRCGLSCLGPAPRVVVCARWWSGALPRCPGHCPKIRGTTKGRKRREGPSLVFPRCHTRRYPQLSGNSVLVGGFCFVSC
ncbi:hypothetical protein LX36DRAFT_422806 [Colletotrichum falcatum]|nr:hypothetical protein LX36DRAFT_422806 [Colletotrichum falcatum]